MNVRERFQISFNCNSDDAELISYLKGASQEMKRSLIRAGYTLLISGKDSQAARASAADPEMMKVLSNVLLSMNGAAMTQNVAANMSGLPPVQEATAPSSASQQSIQPVASVPPQMAQQATTAPVPQAQVSQENMAAMQDTANQLSTGLSSTDVNNRATNNVANQVNTDIQTAPTSSPTVSVKLARPPQVQKPTSQQNSGEMWSPNLESEIKNPYRNNFDNDSSDLPPTPEEAVDDLEDPLAVLGSFGQ